MGLAKKLPGPIRERLKLPVILYFSADVPDSCMLSDETALRAFQALENFRNCGDGKREALDRKSACILPGTFLPHRSPDHDALK